MAAELGWDDARQQQEEVGRYREGIAALLAGEQADGDAGAFQARLAADGAVTL
jgi:hypothetical protein